MREKMNIINNYYYPKITGKDNEFEFAIENHHIKIIAEEDKVEERVLVFVDNNLFTTLRNDKADIKDTVELFHHKVFIHYRVNSEPNNVFRNALLFFNEGIFITVDGKPLEGSIADPTFRIKIASFGYYILAGLTIMSIIFSLRGESIANPTITIFGILIAGVAIIFGLLTKKMPMLFLPLGIIFGTLELFLTLFGVSASINDGSFKTPQGLGAVVFVVLILLRVGIILNFVRGIVAVIKIRTLRILK